MQQVRRLIVGIVFALPLYAGVDYLDVRAGITRLGTSTVETWGQARCMSDSGSVVQASMSGSHILGATGLGGECCVADAYWNYFSSSTGAWADVKYVTTSEGYCYRTQIDAESGALSQGAGSSQVCFEPVAGSDPDGTIDTSQYCPLILDLNGDGVRTTGLEDPVRFWNRNGGKTWSGWTRGDTEEGFLWLDIEVDRQVTEDELFGSRMPSPSGGVHRNGFQALAKFDLPELGGDGDGRITSSDRVWGRLRLWIDRDHDALADPGELLPVGAYHIVALNLARAHDHAELSNGNSLMLIGSYERRIGEHVQRFFMVDIGFVYEP